MFSCSLISKISSENIVDEIEFIVEVAISYEHSENYLVFSTN